MRGEATRDERGEKRDDGRGRKDERRGKWEAKKPPSF
jgi:hypothetical protein